MLQDNFFLFLILIVVHPHAITGLPIDHSSYRQGFYPDMKGQIHYYSWKETLRVSKTVKFGWKMFYSTKNIALLRGKNIHFRFSAVVMDLALLGSIKILSIAGIVYSFVTLISW